MGFFKGFFQVLTCGIGLCLWRRIKQKIGFAKWTLRWQIFCSVSCSLFFVLAILITVILVNLSLLVESTYLKLDNQIDQIYNENLNDTAFEASTSIGFLVDNSRKLLDKTVLISQEALSPHSFSPYPIDTDFTTIYRPSQVANDNVTITYNTEKNGTPSANMTGYIKRITTLNSYWQRLVITRMGKDADINMHRVFVALQNKVTTPSVSCENVVMVYPSRYVPVKNGCGTELDEVLGQGALWSMTVAKKGFTMVNFMMDPLDSPVSLNVEDQVMTMTNVIKDMGNGGNIVGIVGVQFKIRTLRKIIDPLTQQLLPTYYCLMKPQGKSRADILISAEIFDPHMKDVEPIQIEFSDDLIETMMTENVTQTSYNINQTIGDNSYRLNRAYFPKSTDQPPLYTILMAQMMPNKDDTQVLPPLNNPSLLKDEIYSQFRNLVIIVITCSIVLFLMVWVLILRFTQRITYPIKQLTHLTEMIKQATGRDSREQVLNAIETHDIFEQTKKQLKKFDKQSQSSITTNGGGSTVINRKQTIVSQKRAGAAVDLQKSGTEDFTSGLRRTLLEKNRQKNKSKTLSQLKEEETLFESMDEIQELLKIFYKFFVGGRNKPKPSTEENQMKYYKNKYYQPEVYRQDLTVDISEQMAQKTLGGRQVSVVHRRNQGSKDKGGVKINEDTDEEDEILTEDERDQDEDMLGGDDGEIERRMSMLQNEDHEYKPSPAPSKKDEFKKMDIYNTTTEGANEDKFHLNASNKDIFNKKVDITATSNAGSKVTIPIDWDDIIDRYIKNTNTNVMEANKGAGANKGKEDDQDDDF
ncbi:hypothetical protein FGO68_gene7275 [Halteria grandinella]|uniref:Uncharacterized protein n=1 Tax=Halteria grandinella TaxID=5974 RepID=A0A8J8NZ82_HALGN|nr:hypothetical protein FGO68_gene7275 [Halteria grandinella]